MNNKFNVEEDEYYQNFIRESKLADETEKKYKKILTKFCKSTGKTLTEMVTICINEQLIITKEKLPPDENGNERFREIRFNVNSKDASVRIFQDQYIDECERRNNKNITINTEVIQIRNFLKKSGVILPNFTPFKDDSDDWSLPTKADLNYIAQDFTIVHVALLNFLTSTGMRIADALSFTIGDFMEATKEYHDYVDVEDFIDNAPEDMIGTWNFEPKKTRRFHIKCITFNSSDASNLILQNLRHIKNEYIPRRNKEYGPNLKISKNDALFGSRRASFKTPMLPSTVSDVWIGKNGKFKAWKLSQIKQEIENGNLSQEDYEKVKSLIPHFNPHLCRKYFISTVSSNCGNLRVCALLEGHSNVLPNDKSYVKKTVKEIKEIYLNDLHDPLSLSNVETKIITNKETEELNKKVSEADEKIEALTNENAEKDKEIAELKQLVSQTQEQMAETNKTVEELKLKRKRPDIKTTIYDYFYDNYRDDILKKEFEKDGNENIGHKKCIVICELAYELALENKSDFSDDDEYLDKLIKKAKVKCSLNPDMIITKYNEIHGKNLEQYEVNTKISRIVWDIVGIIGNNEDVWEMVKEDQKTLKNIIIKHIRNSNYDIDNITFEDKKQIAEDVMMEVIDVL